jgi:hypothetical protein
MKNILIGSIVFILIWLNQTFAASWDIIYIENQTELYQTWATIWTWTTVKFMFQDNQWVYHIDETFIAQIIVKLVLTGLFFYFMWISTAKTWKQWRKTAWIK